MDKAGLAQLTPTVIDILTKASPDQLKEVDFRRGDTMVWMAFRRGGTKPDIVRNLNWGGKKPFPGFTFVIDDMVQTYTFIVPKPCANLDTGVERAEPREGQAWMPRRPRRTGSRPSASRRNVPQPKRPASKPNAASASASRKNASRRNASRTERLEKERHRRREPRERADRRRTARRREESQVGHLRRRLVRQGTPHTRARRRRRAAAMCFESLCSPLFGVKLGAEFKVSPNFKIAPAVGVRVQLRGEQLLQRLCRSRGQLLCRRAARRSSAPASACGTSPTATTSPRRCWCTPASRSGPTPRRTSCSSSVKAGCSWAATTASRTTTSSSAACVSSSASCRRARSPYRAAPRLRPGCCPFLL